MQVNHIKFCASLLASGLGLAMLLGTSAASAQTAAAPAEPVGKTFGSAGTLSIAVDRLMGLSIENVKLEDDTGVLKFKSTNVALLGRSIDSVTTGQVTIPQFGLTPRLGFDYFVIDGLSVGTSFVLQLGSGKLKGEPEGAPETETDRPKTTSILFNPRVGYALMFSDMFGIWPRVGVTYLTATTKTEAAGVIPESKDTTNALDLTVEVPVVITPVNHFAIFATPFADIGLGGKLKGETGGVDNPETDVRATAFGLSVGIGGYL